MRILADVNIEVALVEWLRAQGNAVTWAAELPPSIPDEELLRLANDTECFLLTYDKDFGELVFRRHMIARGIVLLRFDTGLQADRLALLQRHWQSIAGTTDGNFTVVSDEQIRVRPLGQGGS